MMKALVGFSFFKKKAKQVHSVHLTTAPPKRNGVPYYYHYYFIIMIMMIIIIIILLLPGWVWKSQIIFHTGDICVPW